jgi:transcriptional regulator with XRE-family HTH domain
MANSDNPPALRQRVTNAPQLLSTISARRRALKLPQALLAEKLGIHQSHLSDIETGQRALSVDRLLEIFNMLGLELIVQRRESSKKSEW